MLRFIFSLTIVVLAYQQATAETCVKPLCIVDRWDDTDGDEIHNPGEDFDDSNGNGIWDAGESFSDRNANGTYDGPEPYDPLLTGFVSPTDTGSQLTLKPATLPQPVGAGSFYVVNLPPLGQAEHPVVGETQFREWMSGCSPHDVSPGDSVQIEPGNLIQAIHDEITTIIESDPDAYWDDDSGMVRGSLFPKSTRLILAAFYNPLFRPVSGRKYIHVSKIGLFFVESIDSGAQISVRFVESNPGTLPTIPASWGGLKNRYLGVPPN